MSSRLFTFLVILIASSFAFANSVSAVKARSGVSSAWQSPHLRVSLSSREWIVSHPAPDRLLLEHRSRHLTILVVEYGSSLSKFEAGLYLHRNFVSDATRSRSTFLNLDSSTMQNVLASVSQFDGRVYGATQMTLPTPRGEVQLSERIWAEEGRVWQISVSIDGRFETDRNEKERILDKVMSDVTQRSTQNASAVKVSRMVASQDSKVDGVSTSEFSSETVRASTVNSPVGGLDQQSFFPIPTAKECSDAAIADGKRGVAPYGVKFLSGSLRSCMMGGEDAIKTWANGIKGAFISGMTSVEQHAEDNLRKHPCATPVKPSGFLQWIGYGAQMDAYNSCLESAGSMAVIQSGRDLVVSTAHGISALVSYVRAIDDPVALVTALLQKEAKGFMCLNADSQAAVVCEFISHAAGAILSTALTSGAGAALTAGSEVTLAARGVLAMEAGLRAAKGLMLSPVTVPIATARIAVRATGVAAEFATAGVRGIAAKIAEAQMIRAAAKTEFSDVLERLVKNERTLDAFKQSYLAERSLTGEEARLAGGRIDAANKKLKEIQEAYAPFLARERGEKAKTLSLISTAETMGFSRVRIESALSDGLLCK